MNTETIRRSALLLLLAGTASCVSQPPTEPEACDMAKRYIAAGNSGDARGIAPFLADDVSAVFLSEKGATLSHLQGKAEVLEAVRTYTAQCPSCRSSVRCLLTTGNAVYVIEDVLFTDQDGVEQRQSAPLVIEFDSGKVGAIIYYPSVDAATD